MWKAILSPDFFSTILRSATPILFATLASAIAAKSGICNMALEGIMCVAGPFDHNGYWRFDWYDPGILYPESEDG